MPDLRIAIVGFDDGIDAWQAQVLERLRGLPGVTIDTVLTRPRTPDADFARSLGRKGRAALAHDGHQQALAAASAGDGWHLLLNLTQDPMDVAGGWLELEFDLHPASPVSAVRVLHHPSGCRMRIVAEAILKTGRNERRNVANLLAAAALMFQRAVVAVRDGIERAVTSAPIAAQDPFQRLQRRLIRTMEKVFFRTSWTLGVIDASVQEVLALQAIQKVRLLHGLPRNRFFADPFLLRATNRRMTLLAESASLRPPYKGRICAIEASTRGRVLSVRDALETEEHLSFPFLIRENGDVFCLPERHESGALCAYKIRDGEWTTEATLLGDVAAVDPVLLNHDGRWWLFCGDRAHDDTAHLFLYFADHWRGPWTPHPLNPVKSDVRNSRSGGAIVVHDGALYRPAQDCSRRYGGALVMNRIVALSETAFAEEEAFRVDPQKLSGNFVGLHTINGLGGVTMVDVLERRLVFT